MAEKIQRRNERNWYWEEVNPKTRTIVGALEAADISGARKPSLEKATASAAIEGFGVSLDYVTQTWESSFKEFAELRGIDHDPAAIPKAIIDGLRAGEPDESREVMTELGQCASRRPWAAKLASEAADQILIDDNPYEAIPTLEALSTLAMYRLATEKIDRGPVYIADPPPEPVQQA
jgi:hypothetical protein